MGRHSAPSEDDDEGNLAGTVDLLSLDDGSPVGRHVQVHAAPELGHEVVFTSPPETEAERTTSIPVTEVDLAARADASLAPVTGLPAAELLPILPGEAVVPPPADPAVEVEVAADELLPFIELEPDPAPADVPDGEASAGSATASRPAHPSQPPDDVVVSGSPSPSPPAPSRAPESTESVLHRGASASAADLSLLRTDGALRTRCIAAFLAPFVVYAVVLLVIGSSARTWLIWVWIPTVLACVAAGSLLDIAHRAAATPSPVAVADPPTDGLDAEEPQQGDEASLVGETAVLDEERDAADDSDADTDNSDADAADDSDAGDSDADDSDAGENDALDLGDDARSAGPAADPADDVTAEPVDGAPAER